MTFVPMMPSLKIRLALAGCVLLLGCISVAHAQMEPGTDSLPDSSCAQMVEHARAGTRLTRRPGDERPSLDDLLSALEVSYERAMWVVHTGTSDSALADTIRSRCKRVAALREDTPGESESDSEIEQRWWTVQRLVAVNLDSLAALVGTPLSTSNRPLAPKIRRVEKVTSTPLVSAVTAQVLRQLDPQFGSMGKDAERQARSAAVSGLFDAFRLYRERLLALADEACLERARLCLAVDPDHNHPYWGLTASGYSGDVYGVGLFMSISRITGVHRKVVRGRRAVIGVQVLREPRELAGEISIGSVFGEFVAMPGVIISPRHGNALQMSGSVLYLPRSRLSLGVSFAVDYGLGIRAVYGFKPQPPKPSRTRRPRS